MRNWNFKDYPFHQYPNYSGSDLGIHYSPKHTTFKIWAPTAHEVIVRIYGNGVNSSPLETEWLNRSHEGTWEVQILGDWKDRFYTFQVRDDAGWLNEVPDVGAKAVGLNGNRGMIINLKETNPEGWNQDKGPELKNATDCIIYEAHVRDFSIHPDSGIKNKGKFLAFTEEGTSSPLGVKTGMDHLTELGITHLHLLPIADFHTVDEDSSDPLQYNWGYDPQNFNTPEGWYSSNPYDGKSRIREFKELVKSVHDKGMGVIMDVVYNHTGLILNSIFNQTVPGYYYRHRADGSFSDASGCGTEIASERYMVRKYIIESLKYWAQEYHIDGFRFDLMGIYDIYTMNQIEAELKQINSNIILYGEGWAAAKSPFPEEHRAVKLNTHRLNNIAVFCDDMRDGLKGHWGSNKSLGFISGKTLGEEQVKFGITGAIHHQQIVYHYIESSPDAWAKHPGQCVNFVSCHDNFTLFDKLRLSCPNATEKEYIAMGKLALSLILTSQGIPFLHAGIEFLRSKSGNGNSYRSPDWVNWIDWNRKKQYFEVFDYSQKLIAFRKKHPALRFTTAEEVKSNLNFIEPYIPGVIAYQLKRGNTDDIFSRMIFIFNGNEEICEYPIPEGSWKMIIRDNHFNDRGLKKVTTDFVKVSPISMLVLGEK